MERGLWGFALGTAEPPGEGEPAASRRFIDSAASKHMTYEKNTV